MDTGDYAANAILSKGDEGVTIAGSAWGSTFTAGGQNLEFVDADFNTIYGLTFEGSTGLRVRGDIDPSTNNTIRANTFDTNSSFGIYITQLADSDQILDNVMTGAGTYGLYMGDGVNATITGNDISGRNTGMYLAIDDSLVQSNTLSSGATRGIYLVSTSNVDVLDNAIDTFTSQGIYLTSSIGTEIRGNEISFSGAGIESLSTSPTTIVEDNVIHDNTTGIRGHGTFGPTNWAGGLANDIYDNTTGLWVEINAVVRFNEIHGNTTGVRVDDASANENVSIHHNLIYRNTGQGIYLIDGDTVTIENNTIYTPSGDGVRLESNSSNVTLRNNIIWTEAAGYDIYVATDSQVGFDSDWNNLYTTGTGDVVWFQKVFDDLFDWQVEADWLRFAAEGGYTREVISHFLFLSQRVLGPLELV
jgi:parallel beta-helix repeat protein